MTRVILQDMKTAISLPDQLFRRAEQLASQLGIPRSQLYARAIDEYLESHSNEPVTAALDKVYTDHESGLDRRLAHIQAAALPDEDW
jgi:metal-responsive CopG/Arc/MetJ family transcriptional regulator